MEKHPNQEDIIMTEKPLSQLSIEFPTTGSSSHSPPNNIAEDTQSTPTNTPLSNAEIDFKEDLLIETNDTISKAKIFTTFQVTHQKFVLDADVKNKALIGYTDIHILTLEENISEVRFHCNDTIRKFEEPPCFLLKIG